jgi:hypothetical protein
MEKRSRQTGAVTTEDLEVSWFMGLFHVMSLSCEPGFVLFLFMASIF